MYIIKIDYEPNLYLYDTGVFGPAREMAQQFSAEDAIAKQNFLVIHPPHRIIIDPVARNLADQLTAFQISALAAMLGQKEGGCIFSNTLQKTPPLPHGFTMTDAALAYLDALRAPLVAANRGLRQ